MTVSENLTHFLCNKVRKFTPFQKELLLFCETLSQALFQNSEHKKNPDIIALAFWLRKSHLHQMHQFFQEKGGNLFPRGLVFHIPPANIDVMLVYSWITSLLVGNSNIIRIPSSGTLKSNELLALIYRLLEESKFSAIKEMNFFVEYGHEDAITSLICLQADARIIWGGNETIAKIRKIPLQPHAIDLAFPDRFSFAAINAAAYLQANQEQLATNFFNDAYWFMQSACSSPRLLFWVGEKQIIEEASDLFYNTLQQTIARRQYQISLGGALLKKAFLFTQALLLPIEKIREYSNELNVLFLRNAEDGCRIHCGQGLFYHVPIHQLEEIASFTTHKDQTLTHCGFSEEELQNLAITLNGKGITRIVPIGQALHFTPLWDGRDLFSELTQHNVIQHYGSKQIN